MKKKRPIADCFSVVFRSNPVLSSLEGLSYLGSAIIAGVTPLVWSAVLGNIEQFINGEINTVRTALIIMAAFVISDYLFRIIGRIPTRYFSYNERLTVALKKKLILHAAEIPFESFYDKAHYGSYIKALQAIEKQSAMNMINLTYQIPSLLLGLAIATAALFSFNPILVLLCAVSLLPALLIHLIRNKKKHQSRERMVQAEKTRNHLWNLFMTPDSVADMKVNCLYDIFKGKYRKNRGEFNEEKAKYSVIEFRMNALINVIRTVGYAVCIAILSLSLYNGNISVGVFGAGITTFIAMQSSFERLISCLSEFDDTLRFYDDYSAFLSLPITKKAELPSGEFESVTLNHASYRYPNADSDAVSDISLTIEKGESVAIVGENGAGKSTLVNLLCGLTTPTDGSMRVTGATSQMDNGIIDITATFQDYVRYLFSVRENVAVSDWRRIDDTGKIMATLKSGESEKILNDLELDAQLGRQFNGAELSGGQWQKLAICRCLFKDCGICVFDEPTAQIDPILEEAVFREFTHMCEGKTCILVTHRIGAARLCKRIIVLREGRLVQDGSHEQLVAQNGVYNELYTKQAIWYE